MKKIDLTGKPTIYYPVGSTLIPIDLSFIHKPGEYYKDNGNTPPDSPFKVRDAVKVISEPYIDSYEWCGHEIFDEFIDVEYEGQVWSILNSCAHCKDLREYDTLYGYHPDGKEHPYIPDLDDPRYYRDDEDGWDY